MTSPSRIADSLQLGNNVNGGHSSWSTEAIRDFARDGGGTPPGELAVIADNGDLVIWDESGEVFTVTPARYVIISSSRDSVSFSSQRRT